MSGCQARSKGKRVSDESQSVNFCTVLSLFSIPLHFEGGGEKIRDDNDLVVQKVSFFDTKFHAILLKG